MTSDYSKIYFYFQICLILSGNLVLVIAVYTVYVFVVLSNASYSLTVTLQILLAMLKMGYNRFICLYATQQISDHSINWKVLSSSLILILNNIVALFVVLLVISPSCFRYIFQRPDEVTTYYESEYCYTYDVTSTSITCQESSKYYFSTSISYNPTFCYNFSCSSAVISSFIPVIMYSHMISFFLSFSFQIYLVYKILIKSELHFPVNIRWIFPPILWRIPGSSSDLNEKEICEREIKNRKLFNAKYIYALYFEHFAILIIFGTVNPFISVTTMVIILFLCRCR